jgi:DNA polymerase-3 subunit chi
VASGNKLLILAHEDSHAAISERLWTFRPDSFLAHAADEDEGHEHAQIWLTSDVAVNKIDARFLALTAGLEPPEVKEFDRVFNLFDGTSEVSVSAARDSWKRWSGTEDVNCRYFAQDDQGRWSQKK